MPGRYRVRKYRKVKPYCRGTVHRTVGSVLVSIAFVNICSLNILSTLLALEPRRRPASGSALRPKFCQRIKFAVPVLPFLLDPDLDPDA